MLDTVRRWVGGTASGRRNAYCWFCRKSYVDAGPLVEGPDEVFIRRDCAALCVSLIDEHQPTQVAATAPVE